MSDPIKTTYNDVEIRLLEDSNEWEFELRGRTRRAGSLPKAREAIDKVPKTKRKPFERFEAYMSDYWGGEPFTVVTVTSFAGGSYGKNEWWVAYKDKTRGQREREKVTGRRLIAITDENNAKIDKIKALKAQIEALHGEQEELVESLTRIQPTKEMLED